MKNSVSLICKNLQQIFRLIKTFNNPLLFYTLKHSLLCATQNIIDKRHVYYKKVAINGGENVYYINYFIIINKRQDLQSATSEISIFLIITNFNVLA